MSYFLKPPQFGLVVTHVNLLTSISAPIVAFDVRLCKHFKLIPQPLPRNQPFVRSGRNSEMSALARCKTLSRYSSSTVSLTHRASWHRGQSSLPKFDPSRRFKLTEPPCPGWDIGQGISCTNPLWEEWNEDEKMGWKVWDPEQTLPQFVLLMFSQ